MTQQQTTATERIKKLYFDLRKEIDNLYRKNNFDQDLHVMETITRCKDDTYVNMNFKITKDSYCNFVCNDSISNFIDKVELHEHKERERDKVITIK